MSDEIQNTELSAEQQEKLIANAIAEADVKFHEIIPLESLEKNTVIAFRINPNNINFILSIPMLCKKYEAPLKEKNISILILSPDDKIETLDEKNMNRLGWEKKDKKAIITLDQL